MKKRLPLIALFGLGLLSAPVIMANVDAMLTSFGQTYAEPGQEYEFYAQLTNRGTEDITSITYTQTIEGQEPRQFTVELDQPLASQGRRYVSFKAVAPDELDQTYTIKIALDIVNDTEVNRAAISGKLTTASFVPKHRSMVEDYTGTWCGYCPRGYVAMESMRRDYPGQILGIAYHSSDPMATGKFLTPQVANYAPTIRVNRNTNDPDNTGSPSSVASTALKAANTLALAAVTVEEAEWTDDSHSDARVKATVEFTDDIAAGKYQIEFAFIEDGLKGTTTSWGQYNAYSGSTGDWSDPLWDIFTKGASRVRGLEFNDVCIVNSLKTEGGFTAIPATEGRTPLTFECTFSGVNAIKESGGSKSILQNPDMCHIAAIVSTVSTRAVVNCDWKSVSEPAGIGDVTADENTPAEYFTISGMRVSADGLAPGIYIVRRGSKTSKVVIR